MTVLHHKIQISVKAFEYCFIEKTHHQLNTILSNIIDLNESNKLRKIKNTGIFKNFKDKRPL